MFRTRKDAEKGVILWLCCSWIRRSGKPLCASQGPGAKAPLTETRVTRGGAEILTETKQIQKCFLRTDWDEDVTEPHDSVSLGKNRPLEALNRKDRWWSSG